MGSRRHTDREGPIHEQCLHYLRIALPGAVIHHSANELELAGDSTSKAIAQAKAKRKGMLPGWPDLEILYRGQFWAFEIKAPGGRLSDAQVAVGAAIEANGGRWAVVSSADDVARCLSLWMADASLKPCVRIRMGGDVS